MSSANTIVDDRDPRIIYNPVGSWVLGGAAGEYNGTEMGTATKGATAQFSFSGTSVALYGTVPSNVDSPFGQPAMLFTLDNVPAGSVTVTSQAFNQLRHEYYVSGSINDGQHKLVITYTDSPGQPANFWLDYIMFTPSSGIASKGSTSSSVTSTSSATPSGIASTGSTSSSATSTSSATPSGISSTGNTSSSAISTSSVTPSGIASTGSTSSSAASTNSATQPNSGSSISGSTPENHKANVGAIAGGIAGGVALIAAALLAYFFYRRRHRRGGVYEFGTVSRHELIEPGFRKDMSHSQSTAQLMTEPFHHEPRPPPVQSFSSSARPSTHANSSFYGDSAYESDLAHQPSLSALVPPSSTGSMSIVTPHAPLNPTMSQTFLDGRQPLPSPGIKDSPSNHLRLHEDSRVRLQDGTLVDPGRPNEIPPVYTPY